MTTKRLIHKCIWILFLAVFLLAGIRYAITRDLSNGCNKVYVAPADAAGQVALTGTEALSQRFVPGHDYDGISLLLDHNRSANAGTVTVTIYRDADDSCVLTRTLPVAMTARGRYTYFAGGETIEAEVGEAFRVTAAYNGPAAGVVVARTGEMPEAVATTYSIDDVQAEETMLLGIVTDYQNDPANTRLLLAAFLLITIALGGLVTWWRAIKMNTGRGKAAFLAAYYGVITGLFLIALSMTATRTYETFPLGSLVETAEDGEGDADQTADDTDADQVTDDTDAAALASADAEDAADADPEGGTTLRAGDEWTLKDDGSLDAYITLPADDICGISIPIDLPEYLYTSESLTAQVVEPGTNRVLQTSRYALADILDNEIYLALDDRYDADMQIGLHFITSGMSYAKSPGLYVSDAGDSVNTVYYGGAKQESLQLTATLYQTAVTHSYARPAAFYVVAVLIGLVLAWLLYRRNIPILGAPVSVSGITAQTDSPGSRMQSDCPDVADCNSNTIGAADAASRMQRGGASNHARRRAIAWLLFTILFGIAVIDYAYAEAIVPTQDCIYPEFVSYSADGIHDWSELYADEERVQTLTVTRDALSGVGLMLAGDDMGGSRDSIEDAEIYLELEDGEGNILGAMQYRVGELEALRQLLAEDYTTELPEGFYYVPFSEDLHLATGTELTLYLSASAENARPIYIAENPFDQAHLMAAYHSYGILPGIFRGTMGITFVAVILLAVLAQRMQCSPMAICVGLAAVTGVMLSILIPPFCIPDEMTHIKVIYYLSNQMSGSYDAAGSRMLHVMAGDLDALRNTLESITANRYTDLIAGLFQGQSDNGLIAATRFNNAIHNASIWTYLPSLMGFGLGRMMSVSCMTRIMLARWCNLLAALLLIWYGIRKCPIGRNGLMVILLFPQLLQLIASCSYDAMIIAFSFLFIGNVLHLLYDRDRTALDVTITLLSAMFLGANKYGVYVPILGLGLIPVVQCLMRLNRRMLLTGAGVSIVMAVIAAVQYANAITGYTGSEIYSVADLIRDPLDFIHLLEHTMVTQGDTLFVNMIASGLGPRQVTIPTYVNAAIGVLLYCAWCREQGGRRRIGRNVTQYMVAITVAGILIVCVAMTVGMTPIAGTAIKGLQGRYFLPYFMLAGILAADRLPARPTISQHRIIYWMGVIHLVTIGLIFVSIFAINNVRMI